MNAMLRWVMVLAVAFGLTFLTTDVYAGGKGTKKNQGKAKGKDKAEDAAEGADDADEDRDADAAKGKKKGWGDKDVPPGIAKQGEEKIAKWRAGKAKAKKHLRDRLRKERKDGEAGAEDVDDAVDDLANSGMDVDRLKELLDKAMDKGLSTKEIKEVAGEVADRVRDGIDPKEVKEKAEEALKKAKVTGRDVVAVLREWVAQKAAKAVRGE